MLEDLISSPHELIFNKKKIDTDRDPFEIFKQISMNYEDVFILESLTGPKELSEFSVIGFDPEYTIKCDRREFQIYQNKKIVYKKQVEDPLLELRQILPFIDEKKLRYIGGAVGYVSYDAIKFWEQLPQKRSNNLFPLMEFGIYTDGLIHDKKDNATHYFHIGKKSRLKELEKIINSKDQILAKGISYSKPVSETTKSEFLSNVKKAKQYVYQGEVFQVVISRKFKFRSVQPKELMIVKRFSHVQHLVSHITGTLDEKYDSFDAFRSLFPAGTVSGAPKLRAMEVISELEKSSRGPYAGALGYFSFNRCCDFAIIIRSLFKNGNNAYIQSGAGIVTDSIPTNEYLETEHKAGALFSALQAAKNH